MCGGLATAARQEKEKVSCKRTDETVVYKKQTGKNPSILNPSK